MKRVFADAFFYLAVLNRNDRAHSRAMVLVEDGAVEVVTTVAVCWRWRMRWPHRPSGCLCAISRRACGAVGDEGAPVE